MRGRLLASGKPHPGFKVCGRWIPSPGFVSCSTPSFMASNKASVRQGPSPHPALVPFHSSLPGSAPTWLHFLRRQAPGRVLQPGCVCGPGGLGPQRAGGLGSSVLTGSWRHCGKGRRQILGQSDALRNWSPPGIWHPPTLFVAGSLPPWHKPPLTLLLDSVLLATGSSQ